MASHAENYGLAAPFNTIALFGANGQVAFHVIPYHYLLIEIRLVSVSCTL